MHMHTEDMEWNTVTEDHDTDQSEVKKFWYGASTCMLNM